MVLVFLHLPDHPGVTFPVVAVEPLRANDSLADIVENALAVHRLSYLFLN